jgi:hypothetical protein
LASKLGIQTYQILTNDDEVCIPSLSSIFSTVNPYFNVLGASVNESIVGEQTISGRSSAYEAETGKFKCAIESETEIVLC